MWLEELEMSVKGPATEKLWGVHDSKILPPINWDKY
jgi:hypothetical protein